MCFTWREFFLPSYVMLSIFICSWRRLLLFLDLIFSIDSMSVIDSSVHAASTGYLLFFDLFLDLFFSIFSMSVIDSTTQAASTGSSSSSTSTSCISVLRFEKQQLDQQIAKYQTKLKPAELDSLRQKGIQLEKQAEELSERLKKGGSALQGLFPILSKYVRK